ncbi:MAG: dicarboxylate/amino acid:cation symporter, partial [Pseudomonadota bacterium]
ENEFLRADQNGDQSISRSEERATSGGQRYAAYIKPVGDIFIRLVKMVVVPLILGSLILGAANLGDVRKLGSIGLKAFGFFTLTTAVAVSIGVLSANVFRPGDGLPEDKKQEMLVQFEKTTSNKVASVTTGPQKSEFEKIKDLIVNMVPTNPIKALTEGDMLAIIFFALFTGICVTLIPWGRAETFIKTVDGVNEVVLKMVMLAMETAPYGVFALIVGVVADMGIDILVPLLKYGAVVVGALLLHLTVTHFSFIFFYLRKNPLHYLRAIKEALLLGFSTSSSSATLPISMNVAQKNLNVSNEVSSFVLPLGATINMDGTALYQGVAAIFIAQVYGIDLSFTSQLIMVLTATLASVGAAGVPG